MKCPYCGTENQAGENFCTNCGGYLNTTSSGGDDSATMISGAGSAPTVISSGTSGTLAPSSRLENGRYVVDKILGQGGMGAAVIARDSRVSNKTVVIKELISDNTDPARRQEDVRNFKREVDTLASLDHPLIPRVTDSFQEGSHYFMVQDYVPGENLENYMERVNQPMSEREALAYASQILDILEYLEQQKPPIVHRDIKPANIIVSSRDKRAHLVDFGIARADVAKNTQRKQTSALGTPGYAPPEQYQGNADARSDLYALAATLHHALTNRDPRNYPPFSYPPVRSLNSQLSPEIESVLNRALTMEAKKRYQNAGAMKQAIDDILARRFGVSGDMSTYTLRTSTPLGVGSVPQSVSQATPMQTVAANPLVPPPPPPPSQQYVARPPQPPLAPVPPPPKPQGRGHFLRNFALLIIVILLIAAVLFGIPRILPGQGGVNLPPFNVPSNGIGVIKQVGDQVIGISDGTIAFDINRPDGNLKSQAADRLKKGDTGGAISLLNQAISQDTSDAEALIYRENLRIASAPHVTFVVGTMPSGGDSLVGVGRDDLQGAYLAQKEFNDGAKLPGGLKVRLLIASSGDQSSNATAVAQQILQLKKSDSTFVGVMGWPFSGLTYAAAQVLGPAKIPMVSSTASSDDLTGISPYFFRVAPSNKSQGIAGAKYAQDTLKAKSVALFMDPADLYSQSLANDFSQQFKADGGTIVTTENYTVGKTETLPAALRHALSSNPDLIYFSGYANDVSVLLTDLSSSGAAPNLKILGGDALYELAGYPSSARASFSRLHFTALAYPDEWDVLGLTSKKPAFFKDYPNTFDPQGLHQGSPYGFTRPSSDVMLSYDAQIALLNGYSVAAQKPNPTLADFQQALAATSFQGVSGLIKFGSNGDPIDKAIVILFVDPDGHIKMEKAIGTFMASGF